MKKVRYISGNKERETGIFGLTGKRFVTVITLLVIFSFPGRAAGSEVFRFDERNEVIGSISSYTVRNNETLYEIARKYKTGFNEIVDANPGIAPRSERFADQIFVFTSSVMMFR